MTEERLYITPDDYDFAAANGISAENVRQRVETYGWSIERAVFTPVRQASGNYGWESRKGVAELCGVRYTTYRNRVLRGMDPDLAASTAPKTKGRAPGELWERWGDIAKQNGVKRTTFHMRISKFGWNHERAATTPPYNNSIKR